MTLKNRKHRETFDVLFYHLNRNGRTTIRSIMNFMQATANMHGKILGTSLDDFSEANYTWVFSRFHIKMDKYPGHYERISVDTWRSESKKCFAFREFQVFDEQGILLGAASASAVLIDKSTRKPIDIPEFILSQFAPEEGRALNDDLAPMDVFNDEDYSKSFHVRLSDIDLNQHVNNTSYVDWIIESLPNETLMNDDLVSCEIGYKAEAVYGDTIRSCSSYETAWTEDKTELKSYLHRLLRSSDNKITTIARTVWKKGA